MAFSIATKRALKRTEAGETPYSAAKAEGIALTTIYSAIKKINSGDANYEDSLSEEKKSVSNRVVITINMSKAETQLCQSAADKLQMSRYKFLQSAAIEKAKAVLGIDN